MNYQCVLGVSASGKKETICRMLRLAAKLRRRVLLVTMTNEKLDDILLKLKADVDAANIKAKAAWDKKNKKKAAASDDDSSDEETLKKRKKRQAQNGPEFETCNFVRITSDHGKVHRDVKPWAHSCNKFESQRALRDFILDTTVFATTIRDVNKEFLQCVPVDMCVLDEASIMPEPLAIGALRLGKKFVMFGDYYILNPTVKSYEADKKGFSVSLFRRLCEKYPQNVVILKKQYRMNTQIMKLSNSIAYRGLMKHADKETIGKAGIEIKSVEGSETEKMEQQMPWIKSLRLNKKKVLFLNTDDLMKNTKSKSLAL